MDIQRIVLFAGLAIVSYLMVLAWNEDYHQQPQTEQVAQTNTGSTTGGEDSMVLPEQNQSTGTSEEFSTPESGEQIATATDSDITVEDQFVTVRTDVFELTIDRVSGNLIHSSLTDYDKSLNSREPLKLLTNTNSRTYVMESGLIGRDGPDSRANGSAPVYQTNADSYELSDGQDQLTVDLTYTTNDGVKITKRYQFERNSYEIGVRYLIDNQSNEAWKANFTGKIVRDQAPDPTAQNSMGIQAFLGMVMSSSEDPYEKFDFGDLSETPINQSVTNGWLAFLQHYFLTAWVPEPDQPAQFQTTRRGPLYVMGFVYPA
uniref:membrane protein insertase YidC n=1 Tax=Marinobacter sediminum TaxID=256323 RepID=UPI0035645975